MTKATIIRSIEEIGSKLAELRAAVEQLPEVAVDQRRTTLFVDKVALRPIVIKAFEQMGLRGQLSLLHVSLSAPPGIRLAPPSSLQRGAKL